MSPDTLAAELTLAFKFGGMPAIVCGGVTYWVNSVEHMEFPANTHGIDELQAAMRFSHNRVVPGRQANVSMPHNRKELLVQGYFRLNNPNAEPIGLRLTLNLAQISAILHEVNLS